MNQDKNLPNISHQQFQEILTNLKSLNILLCEFHEEKKLIYSFKTKEFFCPSCYLKYPNSDKKDSEILDLKLFLNKPYVKSLLSILTKALSAQNPKINNSLYKNLQNFLSDFKYLMKKSYEELFSMLKQDYEKASEQIDKIIMGINLDSLMMRSEEAAKTLKESLNNPTNLINLETFSKITDIKEILDNLDEINDPLFEDLSSLMKFQKEKLEDLNSMSSQIKSNISSFSEECSSPYHQNQSLPSAAYSERQINSAVASVDGSPLASAAATSGLAETAAWRA